MGHQVKTLLEGAGLALIIAILTYTGDNVTLLMGGNRNQFFSGAISAGLASMVIYIKARYTTPPDVQERIKERAEAGLPERREEAKEVAKDEVAKIEAKADVQATKPPI